MFLCFFSSIWQDCFSIQSVLSVLYFKFLPSRYWEQRRTTPGNSNREREASSSINPSPPNGLQRFTFFPTFHWIISYLIALFYSWVVSKLLTPIFWAEDYKENIASKTEKSVEKLPKIICILVENLASGHSVVAQFSFIWPEEEDSSRKTVAKKYNSKNKFHFQNFTLFDSRK